VNRGRLLPLIFIGLALGQTGVPPTLESNTVHNNASVPLTAFVYSAGDKLHFYDSLMSQYDLPVLPHQSVTLRGTTSITIAAGLFGDGSSFGDPTLVTRILHRRQYMIAVINRATADMKRKMAAEMKKNDILGEYRVTMNRELQEAADDDERDMIQSVRGSVIRAVSETLRDGVMPVLPYQAMTHQIAILEQRRSVLLSGVPSIR
jgi:hypothetical protein